MFDNNCHNRRNKQKKKQQIHTLICYNGKHCVQKGLNDDELKSSAYKRQTFSSIVENNNENTKLNDNNNDNSREIKFVNIIF